MKKLPTAGAAQFSFPPSRALTMEFGFTKREKMPTKKLTHMCRLTLLEMTAIEQLIELAMEKAPGGKTSKRFEYLFSAHKKLQAVLDSAPDEMVQAATKQLGDWTLKSKSPD
jgi:hypothetical protein